MGLFEKKVRCPNCGKKIPETSVACSYCGKKFGGGGLLEGAVEFIGGFLGGFVNGYNATKYDDDDD